MSNNKRQTIYTSKELRELKEKRKQEETNKHITNFVAIISGNVIHQASESEKTSYVMDSYSAIFTFHNYKEEFVIENKELIIEKLKERFTDARIDIIVCCKVMVNNTLVEIEKLHESVLKFVDKRFYKAKLVIDWSE
jgi:hypothetical protein